jgi:predicted extracellular nuclease
MSCALQLQAQRTSTMRIMFWNTENLFDYMDDKEKNDDDFTPEGKMHWTSKRMNRKIDNMARTIVAVGDSVPPDIIGLCEVENEYVMDRLTRWSTLSNLGYRYVMTSSGDPRGIDVALLYQRDHFRLISTRHITPLRNTRDILHVSGKILTGDTLDLIVCHLPSRRGGAKESEPKRIKAARAIRRLCDSLQTARHTANIVIMGDFNDYPTNNSIRTGLQAQKPAGSVNRRALYDLFLAGEHQKSGHGSYKHKGEWGFLDQFIVSGSLLDSKNRIHTSPTRASEVRLPFLLTEDKSDGGKKPDRTYNGTTYNGGYSDHLPITMELTLKQVRRK